MLTQVEGALGTGGLVALALLATFSFLAWWPAIAAVVLSDRPLWKKIPLFLTLALFPPVSFAILAGAIRRGLTLR